jgi:cellobiose phosphorylase
MRISNGGIFVILEQKTELITFIQGDTRCSFLPTGDVYEFINGGFMVNEFQGNPMDGSVNNIYLRIYGVDGIQSYPLLGIRSKSELRTGENCMEYSGTVNQVSYTVCFCLAADSVWFWKIALEGTGKTVDVVYGQDIGVAEKGSVLTNELYISQYLDHAVLQGENGYVVCSRQNQPQGGYFPYLQQGVLGAQATGFSTDGMQFFGTEYKATNQPAALKGNLENENRQFEFSYTALQTEKFSLNGVCNLTFYGLFKKDHPSAVTKIEYGSELINLLRRSDCQLESPVLKPRLKNVGTPFASPAWSAEELEKRFPQRRLEEIENGTPFSFFTPEHEHVVLQAKELTVERPHGGIITTKIDEENISDGLLSSTNYMYGLFNGQVLAGNTNFHKFLSTPRGLLNVLKNSGQRIYLKLAGEYRILTLPAAYEMAVNSARWYYQLPDDTLTVTTYTVSEQPDLVLEVTSEQGKSYDFIVTNQLIMGEQEFLHPVQMEQNGTVLTFRPDANFWKNSPYPDFHFNMIVPSSAAISDDRIFFTDGKTRNGTLLTISVCDSHAFRIVMQGRVNAEEVKPLADYSYEGERERYQAFYRSMTRSFHLTIEGEEKNRTDKLNETIWWYTHDAIVHFAVPHGLEQPGGAAWGTRDICQGPMEYFLATQHYALAKNVLLRIFGHQFLETGEWPQWFMFDCYTANAGDCHGDVVFWPLKCVSDYVKATNDFDILYTVVDYRRCADGQAAGKTENLLAHIKKAITSIQARFRFGTALISYGGGDWDDTLQPAGEEMKEKLVSAWTQALAYQVIGGLSKWIAFTDPSFAKELKIMADEIGSSFHRYLIKDGVIAGFAYCESASDIHYLLHPQDRETGIHYRLLPLTRSIISGLADEDLAERNVRLITQHLNFPDGVRLMDRPARYSGGVSKMFRRAEQAANVGREISLQYVHAHIRYIEAMAKMGKAQRVWDALFQINPINIRESVPNAVTRQSNVYFSSSDGDFKDRYAYQEHFDLLRDGKIEVKGGWRLYSSGPGIYLQQVVCGLLGIRTEATDLEIDPVLPLSLDGLHFKYQYCGKPITFIYHLSGTGKTVSAVTANGEALVMTPLQNPYRPGGVRINGDILLKKLDCTKELHITLI